jgi:hypothetical protein
MTNITEVESLDEAFKDPAPSIALPESVIVELQRGLLNTVTGQWQTTAEVRELNGKDEEFLSSLENNKKISYAMYVNTLVSRATVRIGDTTIRNNKSIIEELITGDRDILLLAILKATYGPERTFRYPCNDCNTTNNITINIEEDFPMQETTLNLRDPFFVTLKNGTKLKFRYPVGSDNIAMGKGETTAQQSTLLISRCVVWDDHKDSLYSEEWAKNLGLQDRNTILGEILGPKVGPKLGEVKTQCATCDADITINVDWVSLLLA